MSTEKYENLLDQISSLSEDTDPVKDIPNYKEAKKYKRELEKGKKAREDNIADLEEQIKKLEEGAFPTYTKLNNALEKSSYEDRKDVLSSLLYNSVSKNNNYEDEESNNIKEISDEDIEDIENMISTGNRTEPIVRYRVIEKSKNRESVQILVVIPGITPKTTSVKNTSVIAFNFTGSNLKYDKLNDLEYLKNLEGAFTYSNFDELKDSSEIKKQLENSQDIKEYTRLNKNIEEESDSRFKGEVANFFRVFFGKNELGYYSRENLDHLLFAGIITEKEYARLAKQSTGKDLKDYYDATDFNSPLGTVEAKKYEKRREKILNSIELDVENLREELAKKREAIFENVENKKNAEYAIKNFENYLVDSSNNLHIYLESQININNLRKLLDKYKTDKDEALKIIPPKVIQYIRKKKGSKLTRQDLIMLVESTFSNILENKNEYDALFDLPLNPELGDFNEAATAVLAPCTLSDTPTPCELSAKNIIIKKFNEIYKLEDLLKIKTYKYDLQYLKVDSNSGVIIYNNEKIDKNYSTPDDITKVKEAQKNNLMNYFPYLDENRINLV